MSFYRKNSRNTNGGRNRVSNHRAPQCGILQDATDKYISFTCTHDIDDNFFLVLEHFFEEVFIIYMMERL